MTIHVPNKPQKLTWADGLRGLACLSVFNLHFAYDDLDWKAYGRPEAFWGFGEWMETPLFGHIAVALFFIISGRVLLSSYYRNLNAEVLGTAMIRRPFRLLVPVFGTGLLFYLVNSFGWYHIVQTMPNKWPTFQNFRRFSYDMGIMEPTLKGIILQTLSSGMYRGKVLQVPITVEWTIPVEMTGSFFLYAVAIIGHTYSKRRAWIYLVIALYTTWCQMWVGLFTFGLLLAELGHMNFTAKFQKTKIGRVVMLSSLYVGLRFMNRVRYESYFNELGNHYSFDFNNAKIGGDWNDFSVYQPWACFVAIFIMIFIELNSWTRRFLSLRPIVYLGRISFGFYLLHPITMMIVAPRCVLAFFDDGAYLGGINGFFYVYVPTLAVTVACAEVFTRTLDSWGVQSGRYIHEILIGKRSVTPNWAKRSCTFLLNSAMQISWVSRFCGYVQVTQSKLKTSLKLKLGQISMFKRARSEEISLT